ncbi:MAG: glycosyltransferase family 2 protein [Planctomycetota bacterium]
MLEHTQAPMVSIVIVSYNCRELLLGCLSSIQAHVNVSHEVIVVDSASRDFTVESVRKNHPYVRLFPFRKNVGFVAGNNIGFEHARGELILMLNPDTLVGPGTIDGLVSFLFRTLSCAAVGPRLVGADGFDQQSAQFFPSVSGELRKSLGRIWPWAGRSLEDYALSTRMGLAFKSDWVSGACMLMRKKAVLELGGLESLFFMYYEEVDWCKRASNAGWEIWCAPKYKVIHFGSQSALACNEKVLGGNVHRHFQRSRFIYFKKHVGILAACIVEAGAFMRICKNVLKSFGGKTAEECRNLRASAFTELRIGLSMLLHLDRA